MRLLRDGLRYEVCESPVRPDELEPHAKRHIAAHLGAREPYFSGKLLRAHAAEDSLRQSHRRHFPRLAAIRYSDMIGGASPTGYQQRGLGNSKGKASLESHNRLQHTMLSDRPGQTGPLYTVRPMDLQARAKESEQIFASAQQLPPDLRNQVGYSLLTINQAREHLTRVFKLQNERTEHELQGFSEVAEWFDAKSGLWQPQSTFPASVPVSIPVRKRKESPLERCARLVAPYRDQWTQVSPEIITAFYSHTVRKVEVKDNGLIEFRTEDRKIEFMPPSGTPGAHVIPGTKLLAYFHPDDPAFLHLTDGQGRFVGTWLRRSRTTDESTLSQAIRYGQSALKAAKQTAADYSADERARLDAIRARNAELLAANTFVAVADDSALRAPRPALSSPVAAALSSVASERTATRTAATRAAQAAAADILSPSPSPDGRGLGEGLSSDSAATDLLSAISAPEP
jgi:hypothetical protein